MPAARNSNGAYRLFALPSGLLIFLLSLGVTALAAYEANRQLNFRDAINDYLDNNVRSEYTIYYDDILDKLSTTIPSAIYSAIIAAWTLLNTFLFLILFLVWGSGQKMQGHGAGSTAVRFLAGPAGWACLLSVEWVFWLAAAARATQLGAFRSCQADGSKWDGICKVFPAYGGLLWATWVLITLFALISFIFAATMPRTMGGFRSGGDSNNMNNNNGSLQSFDYSKQQQQQQQQAPQPYQYDNGFQPMSVHQMQQGPTYSAPHGGMSHSHGMQSTMGPTGTGGPMM